MLNRRAEGTIDTMNKESLLNKQINPEDFLEEIKRKDQLTEDRVDCFENLKLLQDPDIEKYFVDASEDISKKYFQLLGLTLLHCAQLTGFADDCNTDEVISFIEQAIVAEEKGFAFAGNLAYKRATLAYFKKDIEGLKRYTDEYSLHDDWNIPILKNMLKGLEERGFPNYKEDYRM